LNKNTIICDIIILDRGVIMAKSTLREIPVKNYIKAGLCIILSIVLIFYIAKWYTVYQEDNLNKAIISDYLTEISYDEFSNYLTENSNAIVYIGIATDKTCRSYENKFKNIINNYNLTEDIIYLNITDYSIENTNYIDLFDDKYGTDTKKITSIPAIMVFENGKMTAVLSGDLNKNNTIKFLKKYDVIAD